MRLDKKDLLLYAVTDRKWTAEKTLIEQVEEAINGGVTIVQIREKNLDEKSFLNSAIKINELCKKNKVPFIVNDNVEVAIKSNADGIHVGQTDMEASDVRNKIGNNKILGVSVQTIEQAKIAEKKGADYLGVGAIFPTNSKSDADNVNLETLKKICDSVSIPVVAIGGITIDNLKFLEDTGIDGVALISAIFANKNIKKSTMEFKEKLIEIIK